VASIEEPNNQDHPDTLFAHIAARFEQIELSHWTAVVLEWLARYDGIAERWDPLSIFLSDFIGVGLSPNCWKWEGAFPSSSVIASWLIEQLPHR